MTTGRKEFRTKFVGWRASLLIRGLKENAG